MCGALIGAAFGALLGMATGFTNNAVYDRDPYLEVAAMSGIQTPVGIVLVWLLLWHGRLVSWGMAAEREFVRRGWLPHDVERVVKGERDLQGVRIGDIPEKVAWTRDGDYVLWRDDTGEILQVSNRNDDGWLPDPAIPGVESVADAEPEGLAGEVEMDGQLERGGLLLLAPEKAQQVVEACRRRKIEILGLQAFRVTSEATQPSEEESLHFNYKSDAKEQWREADRHLIARAGTSLFFEVMTIAEWPDVLPELRGCLGNTGGELGGVGLSPP